MQLMVIGVNHATAGVELREQLAIAPQNQVLALSSLRKALNGDDSDSVASGGECEAVILSTCNRTEIVLASEGSVQAYAAAALRWLGHYHNLDAELLEKHLYRHESEQALAHMLRVGSGLDSMVVGEPQILGQLKSAYSASQMARTLGTRLESVFQHIFSVVKRVRSSTAIGQNPVSVAYASVLLAQRIFSNLSEVSVLLIGAGEMIELVAKHIRQVGVADITIANRTIDNALELAESLSGHAMLLSDIPDRLQEFDVVISSTGSQLPILGKGAVERALRKRKHKPVFLVDIAVPRDIEPQVAELSDAYLYSIDDLKDIIEHNLQLRAEEANKAEEIIEQGVSDFRVQMNERKAANLVVAYRQKITRLSEQEMEKALRLLESGEHPEKVLQSFVHNFTRKVMHGPTVGLRDAAGREDQSTLDAAHKLLDPDRD